MELAFPPPSSTPSRCGFCHSPRRPGCVRVVHPDARCEAGGPTHHAFATVLVEWVIRSPHGDVERHALAVCDHAACLGSAETFALITGSNIESRPLTAADVAVHLGLEPAVA